MFWLHSYHTCSKQRLQTPPIPSLTTAMVWGPWDAAAAWVWMWAWVLPVPGLQTLEKHFRNKEFPNGERPGLSPPAATRPLVGTGNAVPVWRFLSLWVGGQQWTLAAGWGWSRAVWAAAPFFWSHTLTSGSDCFWLPGPAGTSSSSSDAAAVTETGTALAEGPGKPLLLRPWAQVLRGVKKRWKSNHPRAWRGGRTALNTRGTSLKPCSYRPGGHVHHS